MYGCKIMVRIGAINFVPFFGPLSMEAERMTGKKWNIWFT